MATVTFENVQKMYGDFQAVKDLNLEIGDGEFMVLVGPSGCGKTTSLRMIAGLEEITAGTLRIGDRVVNDVPPKDRDIAMVFQSYALYPHMSVRENLAFGLKLRKVPKAEIERRVNEAAETIQLQKLLDRKPKELSGGQRQRVALGRAIVREPAVFLMDEPLSNLDAKLRVQTRAEIARLHQRLKTTVVYVTHDQVEAMTMASGSRSFGACSSLTAGLYDGRSTVRRGLHRPRHELFNVTADRATAASCSGNLEILFRRVSGR
jgi:multiple sugar transport system ATP-binding protein